jgi:predicted nucleic acid-binding protein
MFGSKKMKRKSKYQKLIGRPAVVDANVIFDLIELDSLYLLNEVFGKVVIPQDIIQDELDLETLECLESIPYVVGVITSATGYQVYTQNSAKRSLSHCDKMAIAIAAEESFILCTNERLLRDQAIAIKLQLSGTLGIIAAAYLHETIDGGEITRLFTYLIQQGSCYITEDLLNEVLTDLGIPKK